MKKKTVVFFALFFLGLGLVPFLNFLAWQGDLKGFARKENLFSLDQLTPPVSKFLYDHGISLFSDQVVIGRSGWLFLGDRYEQSITAKRQGVTAANKAQADQAIQAMNAWRDYALLRGVKKFNVFVGPDKASMYPEYTASWARPVDYLKIDAVSDLDTKSIFINPVNFLRTQKERFGHELYYQTDTHWNDLGAWLAFAHFIQEVFGDTLQAELRESRDRAGHDLSNFLRIPQWLSDKEPVMQHKSLPEVKVTQYNLATGELIEKGGNPYIGSPNQAIRVVSEGALIDKKVLWLRDSFGTALSPYMARYFAETAQLHYNLVTSDWLSTTIKNYQPDYIFITAVERAIPSGFFLVEPPFEAFSQSELPFSLFGNTIGSNHLAEQGGEYEILGNDPFVVYEFGSQLATEKYTHINIDVSCPGAADTAVDVQLFWDSEQSEVFNEQNSVKVKIPQQGATLHLGQLAQWNAAEQVTKIRLDIDPPSFQQCRYYTQKVAVGVL